MVQLDRIQFTLVERLYEKFENDTTSNASIDTTTILKQKKNRQIDIYDSEIVGVVCLNCAYTCIYLFIYLSVYLLSRQCKPRILVQSMLHGFCAGKLGKIKKSTIKKKRRRKRGMSSPYNNQYLKPKLSKVSTITCNHLTAAYPDLQ